MMVYRTDATPCMIGGSAATSNRRSKLRIVTVLLSVLRGFLRGETLQLSNLMLRRILVEAPGQEGYRS